MFKPNRVGTPTYHNQLITASTAATALAQNIPSFPPIGNVMNATPLGFLDRCYMRWNAAAKTLNAGNKGSLMAQVLINPPVRGDTVGLEVNISMVLNCAGVTVVPAIVELTAAVGTVWGAFANAQNAVTPLSADTSYQPSTQASLAAAQGRFYQCRDNVIIRDTVSGDPSAVYGVGFILYNFTAAAITFTDLEFWASVRQNMDQPGVGYADTRR